MKTTFWVRCEEASSEQESTLGFRLEAWIRFRLRAFRVLTSIEIEMHVNFSQSILAPLDRRRLVCSVVLCGSCDASCACCCVPRGVWLATGASAAQTPSVSQRVTSSACRRSDTWPLATAIQAGWTPHAVSWRKAQQAECLEKGIVQSASCTETHPGSRCPLGGLNTTHCHCSAARDQRRQDSRVCLSESRPQGGRAGARSHPVQAGPDESYTRENHGLSAAVSLQALLYKQVQ